MEDFLSLIMEPIKEVYLKFNAFLPNLLAMLTLLFMGIILARVIKWGLYKILIGMHFDSRCDRMNFTSLLRKADIWSKPTDIVCEVIFWLLITGGLMISLGALQVDALDNLISQVVLYLPRALSAAIILLLGYVFAGFLSRAVLIAAVNSGLHYAKLMAEAVKLLLTVLILAMALEQLHVAPNIVLAAFSIIFGGIVIALAISFGVAGIDSAKKIIQGEMAAKKEEEKGDVEHL